MTLDDLINIDFTGKNLLILGRPSAGKTWLSEVLGGIYKYHTVLHTDNYLLYADHDETRIEGIIEDSGNNRPYIVEGCLGYLLLLEGVIRKCFTPDIVITCDISAGKQREIYLVQRDPSKIQFLKRFDIKMMRILNEYHSLIPVEQKPQFITFNNEF